MKKLIRRLFEWAAQKLGYGDVVMARHEIIKTEMPFVQVQAESRFVSPCPVD